MRDDKTRGVLSKTPRRRSRIPVFSRVVHSCCSNILFFLVIVVPPRSQLVLLQ